jgi:hypothetical protein
MDDAAEKHRTWLEWYAKYRPTIDELVGLVDWAEYRLIREAEGPEAFEAIPGNSKRWTQRRKAAVLHQIASGQLTEAQAISDYELSADELEEWCRAYAANGLPGLRTTRIRTGNSKRWTK